MSADTRYVSFPGSAVVHTEGGATNTLPYGTKLYLDDDDRWVNALTGEQLAEHVDVESFTDKQERPESPGHSELVQQAHRRAAQAENGQVNSSSSPVPGNYSELDEQAAATFVLGLSAYPEAQAVVIAHEKTTPGLNRQTVIDAATEYARQSADNRIDAARELNPDAFDYNVTTDAAPVPGSYGDEALLPPGSTAMAERMLAAAEAGDKSGNAAPSSEEQQDALVSRAKELGVKGNLTQMKAETLLARIEEHAAQVNPQNLNQGPGPGPTGEGQAGGPATPPPSSQGD